MNSSIIEVLADRPAAGRLPLSIVVSGLLLGLPVLSPAAPVACPVRGEVIQWIADYCMLEAQTDDEIAVSDCIAQQLTTTFTDDCAARMHFKRAMCRLSGGGGAPRTSVDACVADPDFMGRTVRHGGVGR
jgi:hypothetical protein